MSRPWARIATALASSAALVTVGVLGTATASSAAPSAPTAVSAVSAAVPTGDRNTRVSRSRTGVRPSAYIGRYYTPRHERTRRCIVRKESGGNYRIASWSGYYRGAYQFNPSLARATARQMGNPGLAGRPMNTWSRFHQDKAFWTVWNRGKGRGHWPTARGC
jgi:hypothetical protein